ncbi:MAG: hypothetical protein ACSHW0_17760 [Thalassotalea sp.]
MPFSRMFFIVIAMLLTACSDPVKEQIAQQIPVTEMRINALGDALAAGEIRNAKLINEYANKVRAIKPELSVLIDEFKKDATKQGPMFIALVDRLKTIKTNPQMFASNQALYEEAINLYQAADPILYSDALSDPLNVLADMSDGVLPRINSVSKSQSMQANNAQDFGVGEQLIGNPNYGNWQTGSNGMSFWAWYGMYSMMGDVFGSRRHSYSDWGRSRNYSYYHDYGRKRYSSPSQLNKQTQIETRTQKSFSQRGQKFTSAYSKNRTGSSSLSGKSQQAQSSANKFNKTTSNKSSYSSYKKSGSNNSSFRNSSTTTSRGFSRGK